MRLFYHKEPETIDGYVSDLETRLRRGLPRVKADEIANEVRAHLDDALTEEIDNGTTRELAEQALLKRFGPVKQYAQEAHQASYTVRRSRRFRVVGRFAAANALGLAVCFAIGPVLQNLSYHYGFMVGAPQMIAVCVAIVLCLLVSAVCALGARLPSTRTYLTYLAIASSIIFAGAGLLYVPYSALPPEVAPKVPKNATALLPGELRRDFRPDIAALRQGRVQKDITLLEVGIAAYARDKETLPVPAILRQGQAYIVPRQQMQGAGLASPAFQSSIARLMPLSIADLDARLDAQPYQTVNSRMEAAYIWRQYGPYWLKGKREDAALSLEIAAQMEAVHRAPWGFNTQAALGFTSTLLRFFLQFLVLPDFVLSHLARWVWMQWRSRRRGQVA